MGLPFCNLNTLHLVNVKYTYLKTDQKDWYTCD